MRIAFLIFFIIVISCKPTQSSDTDDSKNQELINNEPQIAFYFFEALKKHDNTIEIRLNKQNIVKGKLKGIYTDKIPLKNLQDNKWLVSFLNISKNNKIQLQINNPLIEIVEFVNKDSNLEKKTIYHKKKEFVLRVPFNNSIKMVKFEQLTYKEQKININLINQLQLK